MLLMLQIGEAVVDTLLVMMMMDLRMKERRPRREEPATRRVERKNYHFKEPESEGTEIA